MNTIDLVLLCVLLAALSVQQHSEGSSGGGEALLYAQGALLGSGVVARFLWAWSRPAAGAAAAAG